MNVVLVVSPVRVVTRLVTGSSTAAQVLVGAKALIVGSILMLRWRAESHPGRRCHPRTRSGFAFGSERRPHQAVFQQLCTPLCVADIGFAARDVTHMSGVDHPDLVDVVFENPVHWFPIHPGDKP